MPKERPLTFAEVLDISSRISQHTAFVKELGGSIPYRDLNIEEFAELTKNKDEDKTELAMKILFTAWHKADPTVTLEDIRKKIPIKVTLKLVKDITPELFKVGPLGASRGRRVDKQSTS